MPGSLPPCVVESVAHLRELLSSCMHLALLLQRLHAGMSFIKGEARMADLPAICLCQHTIVCGTAQNRSLGKVSSRFSTFFFRYVMMTSFAAASNRAV